MTLGLSKALDFITISVCFLEIGLCQSEGPGSWGMLHEKQTILDIEVWARQTQKPGPGRQYHVNVTSGTPIFTCPLVTFVRIRFNSCTLVVVTRPRLNN